MIYPVPTKRLRVALILLALAELDVDHMYLFPLQENYVRQAGDSVHIYYLHTARMDQFGSK